MNGDKSFYGLGIAPGILGVLDKLNFKSPTPIQERSIPPALEGKDMIGVAQTGTGKTLAFSIPVVQAVLQNKGCGLVVLPTRELALQVHEVFQKIGFPLGVRSAVLIGGESIGRQMRELHHRPQVIIGTPGRILDHLQQKTLNLGQTRILVLDEADRMLDMGFAPQLNKILRVVPKERQTMLFSATMPEAIVNIARSHMKLPVRVEIAPPGTVVSKVTQELFFISREAKPRLLEKLLGEYHGSILVFTRTKFGAKKVARAVRNAGHNTTELHSNRSLNQRREALDGFKSGRYRVLIATDIAARGIDVQGIEVVINYDLPSNAEDYVHRIGRTARAGLAGRAIAFATPDQRNDVRDIERLMRATLPQSKLPELPPMRTPMYEPLTSPSSAHPAYGSHARRPFRAHRPFRRPNRRFRPRR